MQQQSAFASGLVQSLFCGEFQGVGVLVSAACSQTKRNMLVCAFMFVLVAWELVERG